MFEIVFFQRAPINIEIGEGGIGEGEGLKRMPYFCAEKTLKDSRFKITVAPNFSPL